MPAADREALRRVAEECVSLVKTAFGWDLDWSLDSLTVVDEVCGGLLEDGPLNEQRLELWWKLVGAYTGEVLIAAYDGDWIEDERAGGAFAVSAMGITAFPFSTTSRVLRGEPGKSLASLGRVLPAINERRPPTSER